MRAISFKAGDRWGQLTLTGDKQSRFVGKGRKVFVEAVCDCGACRFFNFREIRAGKIISCGCLTKLRWHDFVRRTGADHPHWKGCGQLSGWQWQSWVKSANNRGIEFDITIDEAWSIYEKQHGLCAISGVPIRFALTASRQRQKTASLDRIDSDKGYVLGNVQWVHKRVNYMKGKMLTDELVQWCKTIVEHQTPRENSMHFDELRVADPQQVIDNLLAQITAQAVAIHEKNTKLGIAVATDGMEPLGKDAFEKKIKPRAKPRKKKGEADTPLIPAEEG